MTKDKRQAKWTEHDQLQKRNWARHFKEHPEQLLPGANVRRDVPLAEANLFAKLLFDSPNGPDEGEWTELVDH